MKNIFNMQDDHIDYLNSLKVGEKVIEVGQSGMRGVTGVTYMSKDHGICVMWDNPKGLGTGVTHGTRRIRDVLNEIDRLSKEQSIVKTLENTYLKILMMNPVDPWRLKNQSVLCNLRDSIATARNVSSKEVQDEFEAKAWEENHKQ